jgi:hypothetical protein
MMSYVSSSLISTHPVVLLGSKWCFVAQGRVLPNGIDYSPDGQLCAVALDDNSINFFSVDSAAYVSHQVYVFYLVGFHLDSVRPSDRNEN